MEKLEQIQRVAQRVAMHYVKKMPWLDAGDLVQEATLAALEASPRFDENRVQGSRDRYLVVAAANACRRFIWKFRTAVSPPRPEVGGIPITCVSVDSAAQKFIDTFTSPSALPCDALDQARKNAKIRKVLAALDVKGVVLPIALEERSPAELAKEKGRKLHEVYMAKRDMQRSAKRSPVARQLWEEVRS